MLPPRVVDVVVSMQVPSDLNPTFEHERRSRLRSCQRSARSLSGLDRLPALEEGRWLPQGRAAADGNGRGRTATAS